MSKRSVISVVREDNKTISKAAHVPGRHRLAQQRSEHVRGQRQRAKRAFIFAALCVAVQVVLGIVLVFKPVPATLNSIVTLLSGFGWIGAYFAGIYFLLRSKSVHTGAWLGGSVAAFALVGMSGFVMDGVGIGAGLLLLTGVFGLPFLINARPDKADGRDRQIAEPGTENT